MSEAPAHVGSSEGAAPVAVVPATRAAWLRRPLPEWAWYAITLVATAWFVVLALRLWRADLHVPFNFSGDSIFSFVLARELLDNGWYLTNSRLGAPIGQQLYDFPIGSDNLNLATLAVLAKVSGNAVVAVNLFYILSFFANAIAAFWALRRLLISPPASVMAAVLFAIVPYHFLRNEGHLFLSAYYAVPLGVFLAVEIMQGGSGLASGNRRAIAGRCLLCAIIATAGLYYAVFTLVLLATAAVVALARRERRGAAGAALAASLIAGLLVASDLPTLIYDHQHGKAQGVAVRQPFESEFYGQKLVQMLLPMETHRISALASTRRRYDATDPGGVGLRQPLGSLPSAGFVILGLIALLGAATGVVRLSQRHPLRALSVLSASLFVVATVGGVSSLIAYLITPQVRAWERSTIVFDFLGLAAIALLLDAVLRHRGEARRGLVRVTACGLVLCVGALDQTSNAFIPPFSLLGPAWKADEVFVGQVERSLPRGAMVFQVPYIGFPEVPPVNQLSPEDPMVGYLLSDSLRWSDGAMRGTSADWSATIASEPLREQVVRATAAGFAGVWLDRFGYADGGKSEVPVLARVTRAKPIVASNGRYVFYPLRALRGRLVAATAPTAVNAVGDETVHPLAAVWHDTYPEETGGRDRWRWSSSPSFTVRLDNSASRARDVTVSGTAATALPTASNLSVSIDGRVVKRLVIAPGPGVPFRMTVRVPRGALDLRFDSNATRSAATTDTRTLYVKLLNVSIEPVGVDRAVQRLLRAAG